MVPTRRRTAAMALASCSRCHHVRLQRTSDGSKFEAIYKQYYLLLAS
jgi:cytochrome c553